MRDSIWSLGLRAIRYLARNRRLPKHRVIRYYLRPETISYYLLPGGYSCYPRALTFELTVRCNLKCAMCWWANLRGEQKREYLEEEMSLDEVKDIVDQIRGRIPAIGFTGGEPFLRKDILEIIEYVTKNGFNLGILTNATLIDKYTARAIVDFGVDDLGISIDGKAATHDRIRAVPGSFDRTLNAIRNIQEYKKGKGKEKPRIRINCVLSSVNVNELDGLVPLAAELGVELQFQHMMWLTRETIETHKITVRKLFSIDDPTAGGFENDLSDFDVEALINKIDQIKKKACEMNVPLFFQQFSDAEIIRTWYSSQEIPRRSNCLYPYRGARIRANGNLTPCPFIRYSLGNLKCETFSKIWNGEKARYFRKVFKENGRVFPMCVRCCKA